MRKFNVYARSALALILLLIFSSRPFHFSYAQSASPAAQAEEIMRQLNEAKGETGWALSRQLESLGKEALPVIMEGLKSPRPHVRIACARVAYNLERKTDATVTLLKILQETKDNLTKIDAAELLATLVKDETGYGDPEMIEKQVQDLLDVTLEPAVRLSLAKLLYNVSASVEAIAEIKEILKLKDNDLKLKAALVLAELDHFEASLDILKELSDEPTETGRQARLYLKYKNLQDAYQRKVLTDRGGASTANEFDYAVLDEIMTLIRDRYVDPKKFNEKELINAAAKGMAKSLDRFSDYHDKLEKQRAQESINMKYGGIGAYVSMRNDFLTIERPIYGGPCYQAGLRSLDQITEIEGATTLQTDISDAINKLKGEPGTPVKIKVYRRGWAKEREFTLVRAFIQIKTARGEMLPGQIGYLLITSFGDATADDMAAVMKDLKKQQARAIIIDLRNNSGGLLNAVVRMLDQILPKDQIVVTTRDRVGIVEEYATRDNDRIDLPIYILVNDGSASASEIMAGVLQDYKKGVLIGTRTFGKGSVQNMLELNSTNRESALRLTVSKYYLPSGRSIHKDNGNGAAGGLEPDIKIEPLERALWQDQEGNRIIDTGVLDKYITSRYQANKELLNKLAESDNLDHKSYPGFDDLYQELASQHNIHLTQNEVREIVRDHLRRYVADERRQEFLTDLQKDVILQRAIVKSTADLGVKTESIPEYQTFAHKFDEEKKSDTTTPK
ncbi:MAG: S41 family peptidase [Planctomycetota bacterium]